MNSLFYKTTNKLLSKQRWLCTKYTAVTEINAR